MNEYKILLDTDIGDDIDDSFALALCCKSDEIDLVAVTTVFRNAYCRAKQCKQLITAAGKNVPVYYGEGNPLDGIIPPSPIDDENTKPLTDLTCQYDESMDEMQVEPNAVDAIIRYANEYAGELILVPIGALTNVAKAIQKSPDIVKKIKKIVMMGGMYFYKYPEWNILCDPNAAKIVFESGIEIFAVGLDVTLKCKLENSTLDEFKQSDSPVNKLIVTYLDRWQNAYKCEKSVLHDPLAVSTIFADTCTFKKVYCKVNVSGQDRGVIDISDTHADGFFPANVATEVNPDKFYGILTDRLLNK